MKDLIKKLSAPVKYKWRVQGANRDRTKVQLTAYIDARQVMDILDEYVVWSSSFKEIAGGVFCTISIQYAGDVVSRSDAGNRVEDKEDDQMYDQGFKAAASDAFKRAAVQFGIGRFLYDIPKVWLPCNDKKQPVRPDGSVIWDVTEYMEKEYNKEARTPVKRTPAAAQPAANKTAKPAANTVPASPAVTTPAIADSSTGQNITKKKLDQKTLDAMVKAIAEGKRDDVKKAMPNYDITLQQRTILNALLK